MKAFFAVVFLGLATANAFPADMEPVSFVRTVNQNDHQGNYNFAFESANGIQQQESGSLKAVPDSEEPASVKTGSFSWTSPDGTPFSLSYVADENGFRPIGEHLPTAPPVPQAIVESLAFTRAAKGQPKEQPMGQPTGQPMVQPMSQPIGQPLVQPAPPASDSSYYTSPQAYYSSGRY